MLLKNFQMKREMLIYGGRFELNMDIEVKKSKIHGRGVFAKRDFKKGEIVLKWNPIKLTPEEIKNLTEEQKEYTISNKEGHYWMQPPEKYINHSCNPNTEMDVNNLWDIAIKDIKEGEEITSSYLVIPGEKKICKCGSKNCKGFYLNGKY